MKTKQIVILLSMLALALPLGAQIVLRVPVMSGIWHPVVGSGGAYEITAREGKKSQFEITVVGKEIVAGKAAFWVEMAASDTQSGGNDYMKYLIAPNDKGMVLANVIMQRSDEDPMKMDINMMAERGAAAGAIPSDIRAKANLVGTETVTVPAGIFKCKHFRAKDGSSDTWVSDKVAPYGVVKVQGKNDSIILIKVITDAKDHITGAPKEFDPTQMMHGDVYR
ncbi:MAG: hypothetical protein LAO08_04945 [Acidobacteriia bacterium]|nr:hypothetical protein [Terriglobia bacterium]